MLKFLLALYVSSVIVGFFVTLDICRQAYNNVKQNLLEKYPDSEKEVLKFTNNCKDLSVSTMLFSSICTAFFPVINAMIIAIYIINGELYIDLLQSKTQEAVEGKLLPFLKISKEIKRLEKERGN